jgi:thymidine kinase
LFGQLVEKAAMSQFNPSKLISRVSTTKKTMATDCVVIDELSFSFAPQ